MQMVLSDRSILVLGLSLSGLTVLYLWQKRRRKDVDADPIWFGCGLSSAEIERYGRQVVLPKLGPDGQKDILKASVLIVGAGGLGCPTALYLCAAGIGRLGIADGDTVALSNLHRQIGHVEENLGMQKAMSLRRACLKVNSSSQVEALCFRLDSVPDAAKIIERYDLVIDCTDAPRSRYLLNDAALLAKRPLVTASAVGLSGQLAVYNFEDGPCLRCVFPSFANSTEEAEPVASCEEHGVLGPLVGVVGSWAALEALKLLAVSSGLHATCLRERMLLFDTLDPVQPCRSVRIRRKATCIACQAGSDSPPLPASGCSLRLSGSVSPGISASSLQDRLRRLLPTLVIDVRPVAHFKVSKLQAAFNWPLTEIIQSSEEEIHGKLNNWKANVGDGTTSTSDILLVCACRRGNDSRRATELLRHAGIEAFNLDGGLLALAAAAPVAGAVPALT